MQYYAWELINRENIKLKQILVFVIFFVQIYYVNKNIGTHVA